MPIEYFLDQTIKNPHTNKNYLAGIRTLMSFCNTEDFHDLLKGEAKEMEDRMVACIKHLVNGGMTRSTIFAQDFGQPLIWLTAHLLLSAIGIREHRSASNDIRQLDLTSWSRQLTTKPWNMTFSHPSARKQLAVHRFLYPSPFSTACIPKLS